ncbi:MAG: DNA import protein CedA1 [Caldisphaera sp.]|jgi:hypothetical protein|uniref:DNA import protein CedA1 n=1 Tax=Caldisphaera sp. TaxID=2060322 RepID=UPI0039780637
MDIVTFVQQITERVTALAWAMFLLTWSIGWTLKGSPIPISKLKRAGSSLIEDSIWAAFWLAIGSSMFSFIVYIVNLITS